MNLKNRLFKRVHFCNILSDNHSVFDFCNNYLITLKQAVIRKHDFVTMKSKLNLIPKNEKTTNFYFTFLL